MNAGHRALVTVSAILLTSASCSKLQQTIMSYEEPKWNAISELSDGRVFVTDGNIALDVVWAKPGTVPTDTFPASRFEPLIEWLKRVGTSGGMGIGALKNVGVEGAYGGPGGALLSAKYVDYLRGKLVTHNISFHGRNLDEDVVIMIDGHYAGVMVPVNKNGLGPGVSSTPTHNPFVSPDQRSR